MRKIVKLLLFIICVVAVALWGLSVVPAKKYILIYSGRGADIDCVKSTCDFLKHLATKRKYNIRCIDCQDILDKNWENKTTMIVFPGGADLPYDQDLGEFGCDKIRNFVKTGGVYLGICAGAYFAGNFLDFARGTNLEISGVRKLALFQGTTLGPVLKPYSYDDDSGACAAKLNCKNGEIYAYYNGGCTFIPDTENSMSNVDVVATYADKEHLPAIITCRVGDGLAILSGVHFEMKENISQKEIAEKIFSTEQQLDDLLKCLFNFL